MKILQSLDGEREYRRRMLRNNLWQTSESVLEFECRVYKREQFDAACETATGQKIKHINLG